MKFIRAVVVQGYGVDKVMIETDLPDPCYPYAGRLTINFDAARDSGPSYVRDFFDLIPEIIQRIKAPPFTKQED